MNSKSIPRNFIKATVFSCFMILSLLAVFLPSGCGCGGVVFHLSDLEIIPAEVNINEQVTIKVKVDNDSDEDCCGHVHFYVDGVEEDNKTPCIDENKYTTLTFFTSRDSPGPHTVKIKTLVDEEEGVFTVNEPASVSSEILTMVVNGNGTTAPAAGEHEYSMGETVSITAIPAEGWQFDGWTGPVANSSSANTEVTMDTSKIITANFSQVSPAMVTLTIVVNGSGSVTPAAGLHDYTAGETVNITATPADGWQFDGWTGPVTNSNSAGTSVTMDTSKIITATFSEVPLNLTGVWRLEVTNVNSSCGPEPGWTSEVTIVQDGENLMTTGIKGTHFEVPGIVVSDTVTIGPGAFPESTGTTTATYILTIRSDILMEGTEQWSWTDGTSSCSGGTATVRMTRIS
jgi:uncharacterized repeat protein (TIGR02543 family)